VYYDLPKWISFWKKGRRGIHLHYYLWQIGAFFVAVRLHREFHFELTHHVTFGSCWMPGLVGLLSTPFIWGPVGGAEPYPKEFLGGLGFRNKLFESGKDLAKVWGHLDPLVRLTARRATVILCQTPRTIEYFPRSLRKKATLFPSVGAERSILPQRASAGDARKAFRVISVGDLSYFKGFDLGLRAFARLVKQSLDSEYYIVGDGRERASLSRLASELGLDGHVKFFGVMPRSETLKKYYECDILLHPSLRDPPVYVIVEAMTSGLPVVCLDLGGPSMQVTGESGIKVPAITPEQSERDLAAAMLRLARDVELRQSMSQEALRRVSDHFDWNKKGELINEMYQKALEQYHD
jgi:glycosyltransferase involved in cell wall biosynthesis